MDAELEIGMYMRVCCHKQMLSKIKGSLHISVSYHVVFCETAEHTFLRNLDPF